MKTKKELNNEMCSASEECLAALLPVRDALEVLSGRWKLPILIALSNRPKRFKEISKDINGITDKMLSKELKDLEINKLVTRTVYDTFPPTVEYARTEHSHTLYNVIGALHEWGSLHRNKIIGHLDEDTKSN
ncbi:MULTISPECIES: helix-turn-helix domain-containing protein [unclassified Flavobacterium]|uniref:winged helix-turn-helix transcriptional regulator n=1 Tax=unclassified Flavobacterium TaxID=196869 RepID=UPI0022232D89|nr:MULTISPECIES: helix-turn-helix domain-containing protein [unclassified Flavobacterium]